MTEASERDLSGIVRPTAALEHFTLDRWDPESPLNRFVDQFWKTAWDLPDPFEQPIVGFPVVNFVFQSDGSATVTGPYHRADSRKLAGAGWALGVKFRPGGFRPFINTSMSTLANLVVPATEVFGQTFSALHSDILGSSDTHAHMSLISEFLSELAPAKPTVGEELSKLIEVETAKRPLVTNVSALAKSYGVSVRTLQRLFAEHVGVSPKFVLDRYRVQAAAEAARQPVSSWAELAHQLGYSDQAHMTADLSNAFGAPPAAYNQGER